MVASADAILFDAEQSTNHKHVYCDLLHKIMETIEEHKLSIGDKTPANNILRIGMFL